MPDDLHPFEDARADAVSAGDDLATRQLRRRYDALRDDYEALIDRLGELEDRLAARRQDAPAQAEPLSVMEGVIGPLLRLREEYVQAAAAIQRITQGLDSLAAGTMKGQHALAGEEMSSLRDVDVPAPRAAPSPEPAGRSLERLPVEVKGKGFGDLLDFQEELSRLPGVARVSINAIDNERASLIVELTSDSS